MSALHNALADRASGWFILVLSTVAGLGGLAAAYTSAGFPKVGMALALSATTASAIVLAFKGSLSKNVSLKAVASDLEVPVESLAARASVPLPSETDTQPGKKTL
jgi:hypothetical protein